MSSGEVRRVSRQDIQLVQNLIERCLQLYMNQKEVVATLLDQAKIEPGFTELVWKKLEEENQEFFKAYRLRLMIKQQIIVFNKLLERQAEMMRQSCSTGVLPNGSHVSPAVHLNAAHYGATLRTETMHHPVNSCLPNAFNNVGLSMCSSIQPSSDMYLIKRERDQPAELCNQSSKMGGYQGINGLMIRSDTGYGGSPPFIFGGDGGALDMRPALGEPSVGPLSGMMVNDVLLPDVDTSSFGFLGQIPRNFSLSDLTADFSQSSDILESYPKSPFLTSDSDNLLDPNQGDDKRLDTISEGLSYEDFGSD